jgi:hypothetical protein
MSFRALRDRRSSHGRRWLACSQFVLTGQCSSIITLPRCLEGRPNKAATLASLLGGVGVDGRFVLSFLYSRDIEGEGETGTGLGWAGKIDWLGQPRLE